MIFSFRFMECRRFSDDLGNNSCEVVAFYRTRIIAEGNDTVIWIRFIGCLDDLHQGLRNLPIIHDELASEEPVARVFTIRLRKVEAFHVSRVTLDLFYE